MDTKSFEIINIKCFDDWSMDCIKFGTGQKSFVMIPGLSMKPITASAAAIAGAYKDFCEEYTVYVFDRRNNLPEDYPVCEMARDTAFAMNELGISNADIFGASQGGMIAQQLAVLFPELTNKIVLGSTLSRQNELSRSNFKNWIRLAKEKDFEGINHDMFQKIYSDAFLEKYEKVLPLLEKDGNAEECQRFEILAKACLEFDCFDKLEQIKCPVLVLGAENDKVLSGEASREIAEKLGCEIYLYESFGHAVYDEAEDYKDRIMKFFM